MASPAIAKQGEIWYTILGRQLSTHKLDSADHGRSRRIAKAAANPLDLAIKWEQIVMY